MIDIGKKCCGCRACVQKCPKHCIEMEENEEGFLYPSGKKDACVNCHLCESVCPVLNEVPPRKPLKCYAAKNPDEQIRRDSSSGGVFTMLAEKIIEGDGVVFGAAFNDKWEVEHCYTETKEGLGRFRGSKYVQSNTADSYVRAERFLKSKRTVLYSGTPCQIAGLKRYLGKDYENLITLDFVCHGVPSPGVFRWYLQEELNTYAARKSSKNSVLFSSVHSIPKRDVLVPEGITIKSIHFRDKQRGWKKYSFVLLLAEASAEGKKNTVSLSYTLNENKYLDGFFNDLYLRPCCYDCKFKGLRSGADITIGDFWNLATFNRKWDDDKGVSCIMANTSKGELLFRSLNCDRLSVPFEVITLRNPAVNQSATLNPSKRKAFYENQTLDFITLIGQLCKPSFKHQVYTTVYGFLETLGIMRIIQAVKYYRR